MNLLLYFALVLRASFFSTGGMGNVPALHDDLIARGWATEKIFAEGLAVGQVSPGPNGLWVVSLGYLLGGLRGAILSAIAICLPPLVILLLDRAYHRVKHHSAIVGFVRGLGLAVVGAFRGLLSLPGLPHSVFCSMEHRKRQALSLLRIGLIRKGKLHDHAPASLRPVGERYVPS